MKANHSSSTIATNRKATYHYTLIEEFVAGLVLVGAEVKSLRNNEANINDAYVIVKDQAAYVVNMHIKKYVHSTIQTPEGDRTRKLLLQKKEIKKIAFYKKTHPHCACIALKLFWKNNKAKLKFALAIGKQKWDKRQALKAKDELRIKKSSK